MSMTLAQAEARLAALGVQPFHLPLGPLAPVVEGAITAMGKGDWVVAGPREQVGAVLRGCPPERLTTLWSGARPYKFAPVSAAPGSRALHAVGLALATGGPVLCLLGTASAASGAFYEALNTAALTGAPVVFVVSVFKLSDDAPVGRQLAGSPADVAQALGLSAHRVDPSGVHEAVRNARGAAALIEVTLEK